MISLKHLLHIPHTRGNAFAETTQRILQATYGVARAGCAQIVGAFSLLLTPFVLKTVAEFLKASGSSIVALVLQNPLCILAVTIAVVAIAVLAERKAQARTPTKPASL
jgi:hypothetical protein